MERKALGSVQKGWGAFSLSHHHQWDKEDESCSVYVLFPMVHPALKGAWRNGYGFESPLYALVQCPVETLLGKIVMCKGRPLPRELIRHCWLNLFFGLTSSLKKTKGASTSHRCPQTGDRLQWNKRPVVSIWGDLSNSTRSRKGVHLQYEERRHGFLLSRERSADEGWPMPPHPPSPNTTRPHHLPHARKSLDDVLLNFTTTWQVSLTSKLIFLERGYCEHLDLNE